MIATDVRRHEPISVAAVDDSPALLLGVGASLRAVLPMSTYVSAPTVQALLALHPRVDVVLLDLRLNDGSLPSDNTRVLIDELDVPVLLFSQEARPSVVRACLQAGAAGLVEKNAESDSLAEAIRTVVSGEPWLTSQWAAVVADTDWIRPQLSTREVEALTMYAEGMLLPAVARRMDVSDETVKTTLKRVRQKYQAANRPAPSRTELYLRAVEDGYTEPPEPH
ncbi:response regulator transcription factor [Acidipropionibacterium timonense]|uniref:response regulator transcription factor n=1 Tax=Acidipropionibacterium timonense TaxID=2161818 RepID=UPI001030E2BC|nr:response regulator transcription factor [Acidipropionibacterium timonense]